MIRYHTPNIAVLGGGTGLSTMLRGLKDRSRNITAIVTVTDDGGGSGILRRELGMLPPGDIRNCIQALANTGSAMQDMLNYRFREGTLAGQNLGNLLLAALNDMSPTFDSAVATLSEVLDITGRVLPVTNEDIILQAGFSDGTVVRGETQITDHKRDTDAHITRASLVPEHPQALPEVLEAIRSADMIILGPGSLYTSIIPHLLVDGVADAICSSQAVKVYVLNLMTQDGETEGHTASDHVRALFDHGGPHLFHYMIINDSDIPTDLLENYQREDAVPIPVDIDVLRSMGVEPVFAPVASWTGGLIRHDPAALAGELMRLYYKIATTKVAQ